MTQACFGTGAGRGARRQAGFTLIELMISLLIASIMVGLVFSIYTRMSVAYRGQSEVSELQQSLSAAKNQIVKHVRSAGHLVPNGFYFAGAATNPLSALEVVNDPSSDPTFNADEIRVYYADASAMAAITGIQTANTAVDVDDVDAFAVGDIAVIVNPRSVAAAPAGTAAIAEYDACIVQITNITGSAPGVIEFAGAAAPYNAGTNTHCNDALTIASPPRPNKPMLYRFVGRAFRIDPDPAQRAMGVLQVSPSGGLVAGDWQVMDVGYTDLQVAVRYFEDSDGVDSDGDGDPTRDWYSGAVSPPLGAVPMEASVSLAVRTINSVNLVATGATPNFTEGNPDHNRLGDSPSIALAGVPDASRPEQHRGSHIYRWSSTRIDLRNLGVGR